MRKKMINMMAEVKLTKRKYISLIRNLVCTKIQYIRNFLTSEEKVVTTLAYESLFYIYLLCEVSIYKMLECGVSINLKKKS